MAKLDALIPFILYYETGLSPRYLSLPNSLLFQQAKKRGYANDPDDAGGATMCGVTLATYRNYRRNLGIKTTTIYDLKSISYGDWFNIVKGLFWDRWKADKIQSQAIADILVDWVWASGVHGIKIPQRLLGVSADGKVGNITINALNQQDPEAFFEKLHEARHQFIENLVKNKPSQMKFRKGWLRRIDAITYDSLKYQ